MKTRIAVLIIGILVSPMLLLQARAVTREGNMFEIGDMTVGGNIGVIIAVLMAAGSLLAIRLTRVSMIIFAAAGVAGLITGITTSFIDLLVWGAVALILCGLCFFAGRKAAGQA